MLRLQRYNIFFIFAVALRLNIIKNGLFQLHKRSKDNAIIGVCNIYMAKNRKEHIINKRTN